MRTLVDDLLTSETSQNTGSTVTDTSRRPAPPPMISSRKGGRQAIEKVSAIEQKSEPATRTSEKVTYKDRDGEYEVYEEYIPYKDEEPVEVAPEDFGRITYTDFYDEVEPDDNFVFTDLSEEKEDDGDFNYGVKVVRKRKIGEEPVDDGKAPVQEIVLTNDEPEDLSDIDGQAMLSLAEMKKRKNRKRF